MRFGSSVKGRPVPFEEAAWGVGGSGRASSQKETRFAAKKVTTVTMQIGRVKTSEIRVKIVMARQGKTGLLPVKANHKSMLKPWLDEIELVARIPLLKGMRVLVEGKVVR